MTASSRYNENILLLAVLPGPKKPKDLDSFLRPMIDELSTIARNGMVIHIDQRPEILVNAQLLLFGGDTPGVGDIIGHSHSSTYGCRICWIEGSRGTSGGMYFPGSSNNSPEIRKCIDFRIKPQKSSRERRVKRPLDKKVLYLQLIYNINAHSMNIEV